MVKRKTAGPVRRESRDDLRAPLMSLENVTKVYAGRTVLDKITFELYRGETIGVAGPSGAGKSTLARLLVGLSRPSSGRVFYGDRELGGRLDVARLAGRRQIVFQNPFRSLSPRLTIAQIVTEPAEIIGMEVDPGALLDRVGLSRAFLGDRPGRLSAGECQRVAIARALSTGPELLVLDEPVSALDPVAAAGIIRLIQEDAGLRTVVIVSHNPMMLGHAQRTLSISAEGHLKEKTDQQQ